MAWTKREFNRDLDSYVRSRRRQRVFQGFKSAGLDVDENDDIRDEPVMKPRGMPLSPQMRTIPSPEVRIAQSSPTPQLRSIPSKPQLRSVPSSFRSSSESRQPTKLRSDAQVLMSEDLTPEERAKFDSMKNQGFSKSSDEDEEIKEMKGERKKGLFSAFSKMMKGTPKEKEELPVLESKSDELDPAVQELLKGMLKWLDELPVTAQRKFKQSPEYELYKQVIERYGLSKK